MKILFVITGMQSGGAERVMATLCNELSERHEVRLLSLKDNVSDYVLSPRVEFVSGGVKNQNILASIKVIQSHIDKWKPDVAVSFMTKTNIVALLAKKMAKYKVSMIIAERANPYHTKKIFKIMRKLTYPMADGCVFQTEQAKEYYKNILKCKSEVLRNPLNPDFSIQPYQGLRTKRIVTVGRLSEEKNQKLLINAFSKIASKYIDYKVEIYGDGPLRNELQELINEKNMESRIKLMGRKDSIQKYIQDAEIFVLPSNSEGMPNALLEAMALGLSCIATDCPIGGSAFIINDGENGLLVPMNDVDKMVEAIDKLINNKEFASKLGLRAEDVTKDFNAKKVIAEWEKYISSVVQ